MFGAQAGRGGNAGSRGSEAFLFCQLQVLYRLLVGDGTTGVPRPETLQPPLGRVFEQCLHHSFKVAVFSKPGFS